MSSSIFKKLDVLTVFHLPDSFEKFLASLPKNERKSRRKRLRSLESTHLIDSETVYQAERLSNEFESFLSLHSTQWEAVGKGGHFRAWPLGSDYHRAIVRQLGPTGQLRFYRLKADGEVIVNRYTYCFAKTLYSELPARRTGKEWDRLGVGTTSLLKFIEVAIAEGFREIDSGLGSYEHKTRLGGSEIPVGTWQISGCRWRSRLAARTFLALGALFELFFHKIWYRRIAPRLPRYVGHTQKLFWLRFDA